MQAQSVASRTVSRVIDSTRIMEGAGMVVHRAFPTAALDDLDPFLLLDEMGPLDFRPGQNNGFPDHPHRGFETVTYLLAGGMDHHDSRGNRGSLTPGDVQWMTAGSGLVHSEMPAATLRRDGGRLHGFQLWVNLPRADKMVEPRYQEIPSSGIPAAETPARDVQVKVIAGEALGRKAVIETRTPIFYLHYQLAPGARTTQPAPRGFTTFAYLIDGRAEIGPDSTPLQAGQLAVFTKDGENIRLANPADGATPASILLIGGVPLNEPVARYGPFVMNTRAELQQAFEDYRTGKMGAIDGW